MAEVLYRAKIEHTEKTILMLYKTQYNTYCKLQMLLRMAAGVALVMISLLLELPVWARGILMLLGAWLMVSGDLPGQLRADKALEDRKAALPRMDYVFYKDKLNLSGEGSMDIPYKKLSRLVQDEDYLYLFLSKDSVCMLERASLKPEGPEAFMKFMEEKTGLTWRRERSLLSMNLWDLRQIVRDARDSKR